MFSLLLLLLLLITEKNNKNKNFTLPVLDNVFLSNDKRKGNIMGKVNRNVN